MISGLGAKLTYFLVSCLLLIQTFVSIEFFEGLDDYQNGIEKLLKKGNKNLNTLGKLIDKSDLSNLIYNKNTLADIFKFSVKNRYCSKQQDHSSMVVFDQFGGVKFWVSSADPKTLNGKGSPDKLGSIQVFRNSLLASIEDLKREESDTFLITDLLLTPNGQISAFRVKEAWFSQSICKDVNIL